MEYKYNTNIGRFELINDSNFKDDIAKAEVPLSVILQITRRCHFNCKFCSEATRNLTDTSLEDLKKIKNNLKGVKRVFLSGGEPLIRKDFADVVKIFANEFILGLPTNAVATKEQTQIIKENFSLVNIGFEGPYNITNRVRGDYDLIIDGVKNFIKNDIPFSMTAVIMKSYLEDVLFICDSAAALGAQKLKLVFPIKKGNAVSIPDSEYPTLEDGKILAQRIKEAKKRLGWKTVFTLSTWTEQTNGYSLLMYPNGETYAWPVLDKEDKVEYLGNLITEDIREIWKKYKYKENHFGKYLGKNIDVI